MGRLAAHNMPGRPGSPWQNRSLTVAARQGIDYCVAHCRRHRVRGRMKPGAAERCPARSQAVWNTVVLARSPLFLWIRSATVDLRVFYQKVRQLEKEITGNHAVVVSNETPDGGRPGQMNEVPRAVAARR